MYKEFEVKSLNLNLTYMCVCELLKYWPIIKKKKKNIYVHTPVETSKKKFP